MLQFFTKKFLKLNVVLRKVLVVVVGERKSLGNGIIMVHIITYTIFNIQT